MHEGAHTSLDAAHATAPGWLIARNSDPVFISTYARDFPTREDIAETFVPYLAVRYRSDRISAALAATILETIPNRIAYGHAVTVSTVAARSTDGAGREHITAYRCDPPRVALVHAP